MRSLSFDVNVRTIASFGAKTSPDSNLQLSGLISNVVGHICTMFNVRFSCRFLAHFREQRILLVALAKALLLFSLLSGLAGFRESTEISKRLLIPQACLLEDAT